MTPDCAGCTYFNTKTFGSRVMNMCRLAAREVRLERDHIIEHHRAVTKRVPKCGPSGLNFEAKEAG
jgi:hypothetical protein